MTMLFGGGGLGGALPDPLAGMALPPGLPGTLYANAATYSAMSGKLQASSARQSQMMGAVGPAWLGDGAISCQTAVGHLVDSGRKLGAAAEGGVTALRNCGAGWEAAIAKWQQAQALAAQAVADETAQRNRVNQMAAAGNPIGVMDKALNGFGIDYQSPARAQAVALGQAAIDDFNHATQRAGSELKAVGLTPPPPKPAHHGGSGLLQGAIIGGLALADVGLTVANVLQLGLDPVTDGAEVADTGALVAATTDAAATDAAATDAAATDAAATDAVLTDAVVDPAARRVTLRVGTKAEIRAAAEKTSSGDYFEANTRQIVPKDGPFNYGHKFGFEWWRTQEVARVDGWTREEVIAYENDPSHSIRSRTRLKTKVIATKCHGHE